MTETTDAARGDSLPVISCRGVCVGYDQELVLANIDLEIPRGAFVPFVGPNGAGKTTLLRAILGLVPLRAGTLETPVDTVPAGFGPQHQSIDLLCPVVTRDIVMMGLYPRLGWWGRPSPADREQIDRLLVRFNLSAHSMKPFHELSGGMRQKVLIARALVTGADVLVMDEPTTMLDADSEHEVIHLLHELAAKDGKTVLFAQHGLDLVRNLTDEVCRVNRGMARMISWREMHLEDPEVRADV